MAAAISSPDDFTYLVGERLPKALGKIRFEKTANPPRRRVQWLRSFQFTAPDGSTEVTVRQTFTDVQNVVRMVMRRINSREIAVINPDGSRLYCITNPQDVTVQKLGAEPTNPAAITNDDRLLLLGLFPADIPINAPTDLHL